MTTTKPSSNQGFDEFLIFESESGSEILVSSDEDSTNSDTGTYNEAPQFFKTEVVLHKKPKQHQSPFMMVRAGHFTAIDLE